MKQKNQPIPKRGRLAECFGEIRDLILMVHKKNEGGFHQDENVEC